MRLGLPSVIDWGQNPPQSIFSFICSHGMRDVKEPSEIFTASNPQKSQVPQCFKNIAGLDKKLVVEAGGIEPPSANIPREASTGLGQDYISSHR